MRFRNTHFEERFKYAGEKVILQNDDSDEESKFLR